MIRYECNETHCLYYNDNKPNNCEKNICVYWDDEEDCEDPD